MSERKNGACNSTVKLLMHKKKKRGNQESGKGLKKGGGVWGEVKENEEWM